MVEHGKASCNRAYSHTSSLTFDVMLETNELKRATSLAGLRWLRLRLNLNLCWTSAKEILLRLPFSSPPMTE
jgi:hypothetical protein